MVANITHWHTSCVQTIEDIFYSLKCFYSSYLVLISSNILPISNCDMAQNVILANAMTLKGQGHRSKCMAPSDSLTIKP